MSLTDFQMSVLQLMREEQEDELRRNPRAEVISFGTGYFTDALGLKRFSHGHHKQMIYLVDNGWVHMWKEKTGWKYFALKHAAYVYLTDKMNHAKDSMWRTGLLWNGWDGGKNEPPPFGDPLQHVPAVDILRAVKGSEQMTLFEAVEVYRQSHLSSTNSVSGE